MKNTTNQVLDGPALTLTGVRLTGLIVKSFFLRTLDLGMRTFGTDGVTRCDDVLKPNAGTTAGDQPMASTSKSVWRFGVPVVCLLAGLLLAATHLVSGGDEIRRSDAPRLVDL